MSSTVYLIKCFNDALGGSELMSEPRYAQIARDITGGITSRRFPVGSLLPTELELCDHYGASRHTIRAALRRLQDLGLVSRRKRAGTRVEAARPSSGYNQSLASVEDLVQLAATHVRVVRKIEDCVTDQTLAKELGCPPGTRWLRISSIRLDQGQNKPIGWTDVYVDPAYSGLRKIVRKSPDVLISSLIESRYGRPIEEVRQSIHAVTIPLAVAEELGVQSGSSALKIVRHYLDQAGKVFEISVTIHPADRFAFSMRLRREHT
jgi:GntR family transcriptional regulator